MRGSAELASTNQRIEARRLEIDARDVGAFHLEGRGAIGTLAADGALHLAPDISFAASMAESRPLLDLIDPNAPELGPVHATGRLVRGDQGYRLDDFELDLGTADKLAISAQGKVGPLVPDDPRATELDLAVRFGWPSSQILRPFVGADLPELGKAEGEFGLGGTIASLRIHDARLATKSDAGVAVTATGGIASVQTMTPLAVKGVAFELEARAPSTALLARQLGHELPDFGPVHARASLGDAQGPLALSAIRIVAGPERGAEHRGERCDRQRARLREGGAERRLPDPDQGPARARRHPRQIGCRQAPRQGSPVGRRRIDGRRTPRSGGQGDAPAVAHRQGPDR